MGPRVLSFLAVWLMCVPAQAQLTIAGSVYEDRPALALRQHFTPRSGVTLKLYRDGGDRVPSADDAPAGSATTDSAGVYGFRVQQAGDYWVAVDSRTIGSGGWAEQTFGPSGAWCAHPDGSVRASYFEGPCFGGRSAASDDAAALATSEHVAGVTLRTTATGIDFAFSFDVVTTTADGEGVQGSLRQFLVNANALDGPNRMRFVPLQRAPEQRQTTMGVPPRWWSILAASALPEITGADTIVDGTAYHHLSPSTVANLNAGRIGERPTLRPGERETARQEKPELELIVTGPAGVVCNGTCAVRFLAIQGPATALLLRADASLDHVMIGASPDGEPAAGGSTGVPIEKGSTIARDVLVTSQSSAGILVGPDARLDAARLDISRCGAPGTGGGVVLSSDSAIRSSLIAANPGAGVLLSGSANTVDGSTISSNQAGIVLGADASRNVITRNDLMWNGLGGVSATTATPRENRISANRFDENGLAPIVLGGANAGVLAPQIDSIRVADERVVIRGRAAAGQIVELYQSYATTGTTSSGDSRAPETRQTALPSIGEYNYLGAVNTTPDGSFEAVFPFPTLVASERRRAGVDIETDIWASDVMRSAKPEERAFSGLAIDAAGNTSEMSERRRVD